MSVATAGGSTEGTTEPGASTVRSASCCVGPALADGAGSGDEAGPSAGGAGGTASTPVAGLAGCGEDTGSGRTSEGAGTGMAGPGEGAEPSGAGAGRGGAGRALGAGLRGGARRSASRERASTLIATTSANASSASSQSGLAMWRTMGSRPFDVRLTVASKPEPSGAMLNRTVSCSPLSTKRTARVRFETRDANP